MAIHRGNMARRVLATAPSITIDSTTNYNQNIATFNATVNPNGASTSVKFQYSTNGSTWTDGSTISGLTGSSQSVYSNQTGLSENTLYYVRAVATNSAGTSTSSNTTFTTWHLIEWAMGTGGTYYLSVPTVTPTGGSQVIPSIYNVFILGGGGGNAGYGGSGGGYRLVSSRAFSSTANLQLTLTVGGGGASAGGNGGTTQITASNFTSIDAGGGGYSSGGVAGYGDNPQYGTGAYNSYTNGGKNDPLYIAYGGGGGISGGGGAGAAGNGYGYGGLGGAGGTAYGYNGGAGGSGFGTNGDYGSGSYYGYGSGGYNNGNLNGTAGSAGLIRFQYYGA
jgi:hypothetical protein